MATSVDEREMPAITEEDKVDILRSLGWDEKQARHLARQGAPLVAPKRADAPKPSPPKAKPKMRVDRLVNERRMREAILAVVRPHGWTDAGVRKLGRLAGMAHRTSRDTLKRMEDDSQIKIDAHWGQGRKTGVGVLLSHPAWSQHENAQSLELSRLSPQLRG
jgi:hypothetical protein